MAFLYFKQENVDIVVLEVGMGGRLDATNAVTPLVAVITTISKEHTQYLGDTIEKIAFEKAGIIKDNFKGNCYVVVGESNAALNVIKKICKERNAKFFAPSNEFLQDNGGMIAYLGETMFNSGIWKDINEIDINPRERTDDVEVRWK